MKKTLLTICCTIFVLPAFADLANCDEQGSYVHCAYAQTFHSIDKGYFLKSTITDTTTKRIYNQTVDCIGGAITLTNDSLQRMQVDNNDSISITYEQCSDSKCTQHSDPVTDIFTVTQEPVYSNWIANPTVYPMNWPVHSDWAQCSIDGK